MKFEKAVELMEEGKKVRRDNWYKEAYFKKNGNYVVDENNKTMNMYLENIQNNDWEVYEEKKTLSDKLSVTNKGICYSIKDVKEAMQKLQKRLNHNINWKAHPKKTVEKHIKEVFGDELVK